MSAAVARRASHTAPFLRGDMWWARVPLVDRQSIQKSLGVSGKANEDVAVEVCRFLRWAKGRRESFLLTAIATGITTAGTAYTAYMENRLDAFISELRHGVTDTDLEPYVAKWLKEMERKAKPGAETRANYVRQVRSLIAAGEPFPRSRFTKQKIRDFLGALTISQPNRYRAALSSFANFLVFEDVLPLNPVTQVPMAKEAEPRTLHLTQDEAKKLVEAFDHTRLVRSLHALMLATGMEFGAAVAVRPMDIQGDTIYAAGTKRAHRRRTVTVYPRWSWAWEIAKGEILNWEKDRQVFSAVTIDASHRALKAALKKAGLNPKYTGHDHRHTWAVQAVRDGLALHTISHQLGHRDAAMVLRVYGRFQPQASDYTRSATGTATPTVQAGSDATG